MRSQLVGGVMLIIGTSVGGGMLALPVVTASGGFFHSTVLLVAAWLVMTLGALLILEVSLWLPEGNNLISMAKLTLGKWAQSVTWLVYLLLFYSLISAYVAGGSDLLHNLLGLVNIHSPHWLDPILFVGLLGYIVSQGVSIVDWTNRGLLSVKLVAYAVLVLFIIPHVSFDRLAGGQFSLLSGAIMMTFSSFGFASIIPTLRHYFKGHVRLLRWSIILGSLLSLAIYLLWDFSVQGSIESQGPSGLISMATSGHAASDLTNALSFRLNSPIIRFVARVFTAICVATSFLGVSLGLVDFLADGLKIKKASSQGTGLLMLLSFGPPLLATLFFPGAFILGLSYAGVFCIILLVLLPSLMAWSGRYVKHLAQGYQLGGGKWLIATELLVALVLLFYGLSHLS